MVPSPKIHCILDEPKATIHSHTHSTNSNSFSSIPAAGEVDLLKKTLEKVIKI